MSDLPILRAIAAEDPTVTTYVEILMPYPNDEPVRCAELTPDRDAPPQLPPLQELERQHMISALLLAAAVLAPNPSAATVVLTGIRPPVTVGITNPSCGVIDLRITSPETVWLDGGGELGDQPPFKSGATIRLHRDPGTDIAWSVLYFGDHQVAASGEVVVPPCLAPALEPAPVPIVVDEVPVEIGAPLTIVRSRRGEVFARWTQRVRGAW